MNRNWNKIGAVGTLVGVLLTSFIGIAGLALMWWIYQHPVSTVSADAPAQAVPIAAWMPALIVVAIIGAGVLHFIAIRATHGKTESSDDDLISPTLKGHRLAEVTFARHWKGMADGCADELKVAMDENLQLLAENKRLKEQAKTRESANSRN